MDNPNKLATSGTTTRTTKTKKSTTQTTKKMNNTDPPKTGKTPGAREG